MIRPRTISIVCALAAGLMVPLVGIGAASAAPVHWQRSVFPYGPEPSFCGGLTQQGVDTGKFRMVPRDGIGHYEAEGNYVETWTNLDTGDFVTVKGSYKEHTLHATIDPDGIVTALSSGPGTATVYDSDGHSSPIGRGWSGPSTWSTRWVRPRTRTTTRSCPVRPSSGPGSSSTIATRSSRRSASRLHAASPLP